MVRLQCSVITAWHPANAIPYKTNNRFSPMSLFESVGGLLDSRVVRGMLAPGFNYLAHRQRRGVRRIFYDNGVWIHQTDGEYFAYPHPFIRLDVASLDCFTREVFFREYPPKAGDVIVDVGAGAGEETLTFSRAVGSSGRVLSIEAHPRTFRCLEKLVQYNQLRNVAVVHCAISDPSCKVVQIEDSSHYLRNRTHRNRTLGRAGFSVPAVTLDELIESKQVRKIDFLKMNIEGAERHAIQGMGRTIQCTKTVCICCHDFLAESTHDESLRTRNLVAQFLQASGLEVIHKPEQGELPAYVRDQVWAWNPRWL